MNFIRKFTQLLLLLSHWLEPWETGKCLFRGEYIATPNGFETVMESEGY